MNKKKLWTSLSFSTLLTRHNSEKLNKKNLIKKTTCLTHQAILLTSKKKRMHLGVCTVLTKPKNKTKKNENEN